MLYQTLFCPDHADPPLTLWLIEVKGPTPALALKHNLRQVIVVAQSAVMEYFGTDVFTQEELKNQIHIIGEDGYWLSAEDS